jgi:moderate conductance mechanosensitive channel
MPSVGFLSQEFVINLAASAARIVAIIIFTIIALRFIGAVVDKIFESSAESKKFYIDEKRAKTLIALIKSILRYAVYFIAGLMILQVFRIDTTSILAGAGIIGLAVGVGAQSLVKDVITGFFIIFEDQFAVGDYIMTSDSSGVVEELGFRIVKLRDLNGVLHIIPNGSIGKVTNYTRGTMQAAVNIPVAHDADIIKAWKAVEAAAREIQSEYIEIIEGPKIVGVVEFNQYSIVIRVIAKVIPLEQVKIETALRQRVKQNFDAQGIAFISKMLG